MNSKSLFSLTAVTALAAAAAIASGAARAGEVDTYVHNDVVVSSQVTRAQVQATAKGVQPHGEVAVSAAAPAASNVDAKVLRTQAAQAQRLGQIASGEANI